MTTVLRADGIAQPMVAGELQAATAEGTRVVAAAERFAAAFADGALARDRSGTFAIEHLDALGDGGFLVAAIPSELGGGGVDSIHDLVVASSRLARGDVATTLGVNMHLAIVLNLVLAWRNAVARGTVDRAATLCGLLENTVRGGVVFASAVSERSPQDLTRPRTTARRRDDDWVIDGHKVFATMAPSATIVNTAVTVVDDDGSERYGFALVPAAADGVGFNGDWDAVGMRASDSGSMTLHGVRLPPDRVSASFEVGTFTAALYDRFLPSGALHAAAALGVAESSHVGIVDALRGRRESVVDDPFAMAALADNVVDLTAMQASLELAARRIDAYFESHRDARGTLDEAQAVTAHIQAAKAFVCAGAQRVTDRALALTGGAGYMAGHPLAKAWRDARAGAFMHPFGANRAFDLVARTTLELPVRAEPGSMVPRPSRR